MGSTIFIAGTDRPYDSCDAWNRNITDKIVQEQPDIVILSSANYRIFDGGDYSLALAKSWQPLIDNGLNLALIADTPLPGKDIPECVAANENTLTMCSTPRTKALNNAWPAQEAATTQSGIPAINLSGLICPEDQCAPVIGNVLVYRDANHITATYARTLAGALGEQLQPLGTPTVK